MSVDVVKGVQNGGEVIASAVAVVSGDELTIAPAPSVEDVAIKGAKVFVGMVRN
jgi:hypothetical protein